MATSPEEFTRATAHSTRLRILALLADQSERCVCDITAALDLPQPQISRHLATLRETGVLTDRRAGQWIHYRVDPDIPAWAMDALKAIARGCIGKAPFGDDRNRLMQSRRAQGEKCG